MAANHKSESWVSALTLVNSLADSHSIPVYVVGGFVRDTLLGRRIDSIDLDLAYIDNNDNFPLKASELLGGSYIEFPQFLTSKVLVAKPDLEFDFVRCRKEHYSAPGALPTVAPGALCDDIYRRDFTTNALMVPLKSFLSWYSSSGSIEELRGIVIDKVGGLHHLDQRVLEVLHKDSFKDDPSRVFRAARYLARLDGVQGEILRTSLTDLKANNYLLEISNERCAGEMRKCFSDPEPHASLFHFFSFDVLSQYPRFSFLNNERIRVGKDVLLSQANNDLAQHGPSLWSLYCVWVEETVGYRIIKGFGFKRKKRKLLERFIQTVLADSETSFRLACSKIIKGAVDVT